MSVEIKVPTLGESITEATVVKWLKKEGESFEIDEPLVEIETDKITLEVSAPSAGILEKIQVTEGKDVEVGGILGIINENKKLTSIGNAKNTKGEVRDNNFLKNDDLKRATLALRRAKNRLAIIKKL